MTKLDGFTDFGEAVRYEREQHQQVELGYDAASDALATDGALAKIGCYMAWPDETVPVAAHPYPVVPVADALFPGGYDRDGHSYRQGKTRQEMLVVAAALLWAEFDRLNAAEGQAT